jgi:hypothetical protein
MVDRGDWEIGRARWARKEGKTRLEMQLVADRYSGKQLAIPSNE